MLGTQQLCAPIGAYPDTETSARPTLCTCPPIASQAEVELLVQVMISYLYRALQWAYSHRKHNIDGDEAGLGNDALRDNCGLVGGLGLFSNLTAGWNRQRFASIATGSPRGV